MRAATAKRGATGKVAPFAGNIPELEGLPMVAALRVMIHHRLRLCITRGITWKSIALKANLAPTTVSRAAYNVGARTNLATIDKLCPHLGIKLDARYSEDW